MKALSRPVASRLEKAQVAGIAAHNDATIGELIADAMERVGRDGAISVEEAKGIDTTLDVAHGMRFDRGYLSPYFVNSPEKMTVILENALVLICEKRLSNLQELLPLLEQIAKDGRPLFIIAEDVEGDALATLVVNKMRGLLTCAAVKAPGFGDRRKEILQDIAILTGGEYFAEELGLKLDRAKIESLGSAKRIEVTKDSTTIIGGGGRTRAIEERIAAIRQEIKQTTSTYDQEKLQERLAKLVGGVAVIRVGAATEVELKNKREAIDDAISATRAAVDEGIVPGGGLALLRIIQQVAEEETKADRDERTGIQIFKHALEAPARQIAANSAVDGGVVVAKMREGSGNFGFDAARGEFTDLIAAGIVDPTKVLRIALENSVSVASVLLLTEATVTNIPEKHESERQFPGEPPA